MINTASSVMKPSAIVYWPFGHDDDITGINW